MGEGDVDPAPGVVGFGEVAQDDGGDDAATTAALRAGFDPAFVGAVSPGKAVGVGLIAAAEGLEAARREGAEDFVLRGILRRGGGRRGRTDGKQDHSQESLPRVLISCTGKAIVMRAFYRAKAPVALKGRFFVNENRQHGFQSRVTAIPPARRFVKPARVPSALKREQFFKLSEECLWSKNFGAWCC